MQRLAIKKGFTLIELLIVITIMSLLIGLGSPVLFKASRIYRFEKDMNYIQGMISSMRSAALNNRVLPEAASTPYLSSSCPNSSGIGFDTNFDNICGDTTPFFYVFEIEHDSLGEATMRTYGEFTTDEIYDSSTDILLEERTFSENYTFSYEGWKLPFPPMTAFTPTNPIIAPTSQSFYFRFQPPYGEVEMSSDTFGIYKVTMTIEDPNLDREFEIMIDKVSGIPLVIDF